MKVRSIYKFNFVLLSRNLHHHSYYLIHNLVLRIAWPLQHNAEASWSLLTWRKENKVVKFVFLFWKIYWKEILENEFCTVVPFFLVDCEAAVDARNFFELLSLTSLIFLERHWSVAGDWKHWDGGMILKCLSKDTELLSEECMAISDTCFSSFENLILSGIDEDRYFSRYKSRSRVVEWVLTG